MIVNFGKTTSSHMPILMELISQFHIKSVIEFGAGLFSSELFAKNCENIISYETHKEWYEFIKKHLSVYDNFILHYIETDYLVHHTDHILPKYDLAFVDTQNKIRVPLIQSASVFADIIICHDTQVPFLINETVNGFYKIIFTKAPYKHKNKSRPYTTLWTKREDVYNYFLNIKEESLYDKYKFPYGIFYEEVKMEKRIISFGLWGTDPKYLKGAVENAKLQPEIYPGWTCRFFVGSDVPLQTIKELRALKSEIVLTKKPGTYKKARYWRIGIAFDKTVDRFIIRDCDSRINAREAAAVQEWINSKRPVHIMRDHKRHTAPIMGGMWGAVKGFFPELEQKYDSWTRRVLDGWIPFPRIGKKDGDQAFLAQVIWPVVKDNHIAHDDRKTKTGNELPFTVKLTGKDFVGKQYDIQV